MAIDARTWEYTGVAKAVYNALDFVERVSGLLTAAVTNIVTTGPAPLCVAFDGSGSTATTVATPLKELLYVWDFGDSGATFENRPGVDANVGYGPVNAHVYETPGVKNGSLTIYDRYGNSAQQTFQITVIDPDVHYTDTYVCAFDSDFTGAPATSGAGTQITTFAEIDTIFAGMSGTSPATRILMKRGTSATVLQGESLDPRNDDNELLLADWGSGAKPKLVMDAAKDDWLFFGGMDKFILYNVDVEGVYDPVTGTGNRCDVYFILNGSSLNLQYKCKMSKMALNVYYAGNDSSNFHNCTIDCDISDWADYGRLGDGGEYCAIIGNSIKQNPNAVSTSGGKGQGGPDHGPIRIGYPDRCVIQYNDLFNNAGWSSAGLAHQPCVRVGTSATPLKTVVSHNLMEGGFYGMESIVANSDVVAGDAKELIIEKNTFTATSNTEHSYVSCYGGTIFRNNLCIKSDNAGPPLGSGTYLAMAMFYQVATDSTASLAAISELYNNTMICRNTDGTYTANTGILRINTAFTKFDLRNNIGYVANSSAGNTGMLYKVDAGGVSEITEDNNDFYCPDGSDYATDNATGYTLANWRTTTSQGANSIESDPLFVNPANDDGALQVGSPARNAAALIDGLIDDLNDVNRGSTPDIGAVEYV